MTGQIPIKAGRREWLGLLVIALPTFVVAIDLFVLLLAVPQLSADLKADSNQQLWIMDMYGFLLAGFLVTMGTLGDRIGRRKLLIIGSAAFAVASLLCAYSQTPEMLIAARALLGIAGATLGPCALGLIHFMFKDPKQLMVAFGVWGGTFTVGALLGPILGGFLLANYWWGSVFVLGVPLMVAVLIFAPIILPEFKNPNAGKLDPTSVVLSLAAMLPIIYGIKELARNGWEFVPTASLVFGLVCAVVFVKRQRKLADPLMDLSLFGNAKVTSPLSMALSYSSVGGAVMLFMVLYFQLVEGMSAVGAAVAMIPGMATATIGFNVAPKLAAKFKPGYVIAAGGIGVAIVMLSFVAIGTTGGTWHFIIGFAILSFVGAPIIGLATPLVLGAAPPEKAGAAGSLVQLSSEFGGTLGIAVLGTVGTAVYRAQIADDVPADIPAGAATAAGDSLAGAYDAAATLPAAQSGSLIEPANVAFASGLHTVALIGGLLIGTVAVITAVRLRHVPPMGGGATSDTPEEQADSADEIGKESVKPVA
ncbi:MFS transporter, DHA2 family, multidrug resistance protein [Actinokineospora alba]|uniref:MFS transporter, DHA2 family, multidrug resistance protein n=1 Tax=Actinokineospora alba TaxID=504798 RepID=A0A1H0HBW6_9PSEU|nr:MFS transporter [Actinokineospora alba]TDP64947.1 DHA2 family multidrug resistance protein-like MFS transporter [Actinokineospora alba]SDH50029.1 MFS transporter, DHA2 family, multidrug resistance protein [Actinokineospora alba]SDO16647.1 MFS transporter, DHA2 family, multidrug resistance protein [Actinokineospora alba]